MSTRDDIKDFLVSDLPGQVSALTLSAYAGQAERVLDDDVAVRIRYVSRKPVRRDTGQERHELELIMRHKGWDQSDEDGQAELLEEAADEVIAAYDGALATFVAGLSDVTVERVRCFRSGPTRVDVNRFEREVTLTLEIDEMRA